MDHGCRSPSGAGRLRAVASGPIAVDRCRARHEVRRRHVRGRLRTRNPARAEPRRGRRRDALSKGFARRIIAGRRMVFGSRRQALRGPENRRIRVAPSEASRARPIIVSDDRNRKIIARFASNRKSARASARVRRRARCPRRRVFAPVIVRCVRMALRVHPISSKFRFKLELDRRLRGDAACSRAMLRAWVRTAGRAYER
jgi:hypothetical protein